MRARRGLLWLLAGLAQEFIAAHQLREHQQGFLLGKGGPRALARSQAKGQIGISSPLFLLLVGLVGEKAFRPKPVGFTPVLLVALDHPRRNG